MTAKKKAPPKKKAVKKHATKKKQAPIKKAATAKKKAVAVPKNTRKKAPAKQSARVAAVPRKTKRATKPSVRQSPVKPKAVKKKVRARARRLGPVPKYHLNHQSWDRPAVVDEIAERLATSSLGLAYICDNNKDLPGVSTVLGWFNEEAKAGGGPLLDMYAHAKEDQADFMAGEIIEIADNQVSEPLVIDGVPVIVNGELVRITTPAGVNHARLRVDSRKFIASKLKPRVYGDKLELSGNPERPLAGMTDDQLALRRKQLEDKLAEHEPD